MHRNSQQQQPQQQPQDESALYDELDRLRPNSNAAGQDFRAGTKGSIGSAGAGIDGNVVDMELEHAIGFSGLRSSVHVQPNGDRYYFVAGGCVVVGSLSDAHEQIFLRGHDEDISAFRLSRSGRFMVSGQKGHNADVCLWDTATFQQVQRFHEHEGGVLVVDISPDDSIVASIGVERRLAFFDTSNGGIITHTPLSVIVPPTESILDVAMGPRVQDIKRRETNVNHVAVVTTSAILYYHLDPFESKLVPQRLNMTSFQRKFLTAKFSLDGEFLIVGSEAGEVALISTHSGTVACTARVCSVGVREIAVCSTESADGISRGSNSGGNGATSNFSGTGTTNGGSFKYARFGPGSDRKTTFFVGGGDGVVAGCVVPEHSSPSVEIFSKTKLDTSVTSLSVVSGSRVSHSVLAGTARGSVQLIQVAPPTAPIRDDERLKLISDAVCAPYDVIAPHPGQPEKFVTASADGLLRLWELNQYRILGVFEYSTKEGQQPRCTGIQICEGLEIMLSSWTDGCVRCHDLTNFKLLWLHSRVHRAAVTAICLSKSAKYYVTGSTEGDIKIWDIRSRELKGELKDHRQPIVSLQIFDDDRHLLSSSKDRTLIAWDLTSFKRVALLETHAGPLTSTLLCQNQVNIYTASMDHTIAMWDIRQKEPARQIPYCPAGSEAYCTTLNRSIDERLLCTGGTDQIVQLWDERRLKPISKGYGHSASVVQAAFTADSRQVLSCGADACVMVWNVYSAEQ